MKSAMLNLFSAFWVCNYSCLVLIINVVLYRLLILVSASLVNVFVF